MIASLNLGAVTVSCIELLRFMESGFGGGGEEALEER